MAYRFEDLPLVNDRGKTKVLRRYGAGVLDVLEKNDMTAFNGKRHELIPGKGKVCAAVTGIMFELAARQEIPHCLIEPVVPGINRVREVSMRPYEVVERTKATGSYCVRHPEIRDGETFDTPVVEFYLKSKGRQFAGIQLPDDDPLIVARDENGIVVAHPALRDGSEEQRASLVHIPAPLIYGGPMHDFREMELMARGVGRAFRCGWWSVRCDPIDFKIEFGVTSYGKLLLADSLSPDEMRVRTADGRLICKEPFRKGASVDEMVELYTEALVLASQMYV